MPHAAWASQKCRERVNRGFKKRNDTLGLKFQDDRLDTFLPSGVLVGFKNEVILYFKPFYQLHPWLNQNLKPLPPAFYKILLYH